MGCQRMDAVTYPDASVVEFVSAHLVPVRVRYDAEPISTNFQIRWTPTLVTLDPEGNEHHRTVGYLEPNELIASLALGIAKWHFDTKQFDQAAAGMESVIQQFPDTDAAPEAQYLLGVSKYKMSHDLTNMRDAYRELKAKYSGSEWTKRAAVYSQLP